MVTIYKIVILGIHGGNGSDYLPIQQMAFDFQIILMSSNIINEIPFLCVKFDISYII